MDAPFAEAIRGPEPPGGKVAAPVARVSTLVVGGVAGNGAYWSKQRADI